MPIPQLLQPTSLLIRRRLLIGPGILGALTIIEVLLISFFGKQNPARAGEEWGLVIAFVLSAVAVPVVVGASVLIFHFTKTKLAFWIALAILSATVLIVGTLSFLGK